MTEPEFARVDLGEFEKQLEPEVKEEAQKLNRELSNQEIDQAINEGRKPIIDGLIRDGVAKPTGSLNEKKGLIMPVDESETSHLFITYDGDIGTIEPSHSNPDLLPRYKDKFSPSENQYVVPEPVQDFINALRMRGHTEGFRVALSNDPNATNEELDQLDTKIEQAFAYADRSKEASRRDEVKRRSNKTFLIAGTKRGYISPPDGPINQPGVQG